MACEPGALTASSKSADRFRPLDGVSSFDAQTLRHSSRLRTRLVIETRTSPSAVTDPFTFGRKHELVVKVERLQADEIRIDPPPAAIEDELIPKDVRERGVAALSKPC